MENMLYNISQVLGITLIHSLLQGLLVYGVLKIMLASLAGVASSKKHLLAISALAVITGWFFYTLFNEISIYQWIMVKQDKLTAMPLMLGIPANFHQLNAEALRYYYSIEKYLPYVSAIYFVGLFFNSIKLLIARNRINFIKRNIIESTFMQEQVNRFSAALAITRNVKSGLSSLVDVPCISGYWKPVIMLPLTLTTTLNADEVEAILLHELAHIKRNDYLVNIFQQMALALLFFNPFAQLIDSIINREREHSCDDVVISVSGKPLAYANALLKLEQNRSRDWQPALAATGKKYHLLNRIERIMKPGHNGGNVKHILLTVVLFSAGIISLAWLNPTVANGKISIRNVKPIIKQAIAAVSASADTTPAADTVPKKVSSKLASTADLPPFKDSDTAHAKNSESSYQIFGYGDKKMEMLETDANKHANFVMNYYKSDRYNDLMIKAYGPKGKVHFYNNDTLRNIMTGIDDLGTRIKMNYGDKNSELQSLIQRRWDLGKTLGKYYGSKQFKELSSRLQKNYKIAEGRDYFGDSNYPNYQRYRQALKAAVPARIDAQTIELTAVSSKIKDIYSSAIFKETFKRLTALIDSMKTYYKTPHVVQYKDTLYAKRHIANAEERAAQQKYYAELQAYLNSPELEKEKQLMEEASNKVRDYMHSAEFKQHVQQWKNQLHTTLGKNYDGIVHPDSLAVK